MAPSSLKGFAGYGTFTTRDLAQEESILGTADGVAIPVETKWDKHSSPKLDERKAWWSIWGNYVYVVMINGAAFWVLLWIVPGVYTYSASDSFVPNSFVSNSLFVLETQMGARIA